MGEILRHAEIFHNTLEKIGLLRPDEEYTYVELGNFLTDISQFRDPFAHMLAKRTIWNKAKRSNRFLDILSSIPILGILTDTILDVVDADQWLDQLMGKYAPVNSRYGKLAEYFEHIMLGITHMIFSDDIPKKEALISMLPAQFQQLDPIPAAEIDRIYRNFFTQYYPHEHCDYPPYVLSGEQRILNKMYQRGSRGIIQFVEEYIQLLSEELSKLELDWKEKRNLTKKSPERHDILVGFGKALHTVEDYFFHTNFVELHLWNTKRRQYSSVEPEEIFKARFSKDALKAYRNYRGYNEYGTENSAIDSDVGNQTRWRRKLMRRLRYPVYDSQNRLSTSESLSSLNLIYPGGFESKDMFHTMAGALESMEALLAGFDKLGSEVPAAFRSSLGLSTSGSLRESELVLIRTLFNKEERTRLDNDPDYLKSQIVRHVEQLNSNIYEKNIEYFHKLGFLNQQAANSFSKAVTLDKGVESLHSQTPGCSGFLIQFLAEAQGELNDSRRESIRKDSEHNGTPNEGNVLDERSDNGASGEAVGTHTLLSKDTPKSQPLHEDSEVLGKFASLAVVRLLLTEINENRDSGTGLDWDRILRHLIRFPSARPTTWETQALKYFRQSGVNPNYQDIYDRPEYPIISVFHQDQRLLQRRNGKRREEMEMMYVKLEEKADRYMMVNIIPK